jgi:Ni2+-binding GTPase involved in maturation of urease and hydrogenase
MTAAQHGARPWIVIVGGFLGSGKTSLILAAARVLEQRGLRCAVILNDQGEELVDTRHAGMEGMIAREVTGGCFCCRFSALAAVIEALRPSAPDVIFAEPVGSCTDLAATVFGPLRQDFDAYRLAPFTVLVDPARAASMVVEGADPDLEFLFQKQIEEADLVCLTKSDLAPALGPTESLGGASARSLSAKTGQGVEAWLDEILFQDGDAGRTALEIDYARYAQAEAALAWLNLSFTLEPDAARAPALVVGPFLDGLDAALSAAGVAIVHLKVLDTSPTGWVKAAVCANGELPRVEGDLDASPAGRHEVLVNLRARGEAAQVRALVERQLELFAGTVRAMRLDCFSPAAPRPERRVIVSSR